MRILITNAELQQRAGTQLYVRDLAMALLAQGHQPIVYSPRLGDIAQDLRDATVSVVDRLEQVAISPDIIHGNQHVETMTALLHFRCVPAIYVCHSWSNQSEAPPIFPRILRYVAVDQTCYDRVTTLHGIEPAKASVIPNFVDLKRFKPRDPLPARPRRALIFSNRDDQLEAVRQACARAGIELDVLGAAFGAVCERPEFELSKYDLVFGKGRAALEAMAVGAAVILCDAMGSGPMVTLYDLPYLRGVNFGVRALQGPLTIEAVEREIARYDPDDALSVSQSIRSSAGMEIAVSRLTELYSEVISQFAGNGQCDLDEEGRAAARYLQQLSSDEPSDDESVKLAAFREDILNSKAFKLVSVWWRLRRPARRVPKR